MANHRHFHIGPLRDDGFGGLVGGFIESQHPRGKGGKFTKKGQGVAKQAVSLGKQAAKSTLKGIGSFARQIGGEGREDYEALQHHFQPGSQTRKSLGSKIRHAAASLPTLLKTHLKEQKHTVINAGNALKSISTGNKPTAREVYALTKFGSMIAMSVAGALTHGDPTGAVGHAILAFVQDAAQHTALEHAGEASAGLGRFAYIRAKQHRLYTKGVRKPQAIRGDAAPQIEYELLQKFLHRLADNIENMPLRNRNG